MANNNLTTLPVQLVEVNGKLYLIWLN